MSESSETKLNSQTGEQNRFFVNRSIDTADVTTSQDATITSTRDALEVSFPEFRTYSGTFAQTHREAARLNALSVSDEEWEKLLKERQQLLNKVLDKTITIKESNRLEYVRWSLDRIEDARHGGALDQLEERISRYEKFLDDLDDFKKQLIRSRKRR